MLKVPSKLDIPEYPDNPAKQRAYTLYVVEGRSSMIVTKDLRLPLAKFHAWRERDNWDEKRAENLKYLRRAAVEEAGIYAANLVRPILVKYGALQERLLDAVDNTLDAIEAAGKHPTVNELHKISQAVSTCHTVGKHLLGLAGVAAPDPDETKPPQQLAVQVNVLNALYDQIEDARKV